MKYNEQIYYELCSIAKLCKNYFYWRKNISEGGWEMDNYVDQVIEKAEKLKKLREQQRKEYN